MPEPQGSASPIDVAQATRIVTTAAALRPEKSVSVAAAAGQVLAQDVTAERDQPPFDRVMMDGIAVSHHMLENGIRRFARQGIQAAGAPRQTLARRENCIEVMTGAVLPEGCDCVVPVEDIVLDGDHAELLAKASVSARQFVHPTGSDYRKDTVLLLRGDRVGGPEMAVLASAGPARVRIATPPTICILAVGDELVDPGAAIGPAQIRRSNDFAIAALLHGKGLAVATRARLPDDPGQLRQGIDAALRDHDIVILTGGVSMGKYDYIPTIMSELGVEILLHKVRQRPGKPMWAGRRAACLVLALPGNPVSALVCARRYAVPAIEAALGHQPMQETLALGAPLDHPVNLTWFVPVVLTRSNSGMTGEPRLPNTSGDFRALAGTAGFVELPADRDRFPAGYVATFWHW